MSINPATFNVRDVTIKRGDDWRQPLGLRNVDPTWLTAHPTATATELAAAPRVPRDLTGCTFRSQVRNSAGPVTVTSTVDADPTTGGLTLTLAHTVTAGMLGSYRWDCELTDADGEVTTFIGGAFTVAQDATYV